MNNDLTIRKKNYAAAKEIKASAHYAYVVNGITLDGSKFSVNEPVEGTFTAGKSNPVILDESIQFKAKDDGTNPDLTAGQVLVHGAVYTSMLVGVTTAFKNTMGGAMRFVD